MPTQRSRGREKPSHAIMPGGITTSAPPLSFLSGRRSCPLDRGGLPLSHVLFMHIPHPSSLFPLTHTSAKKKEKKLRTSLSLSLSLFPFLLSRPRRALSEASSSMQGFLPSFLPPAAFEEVISSTLAGGGDPYSISRDWRRRRRRDGEGSFLSRHFSP